MRAKRIIIRIGGATAILVGLAFGFYYFILDWQGRPVCHKGIMLGFLNVIHPSGGDILHDPKPFPNVKGRSQDSLATIRDGMGGYMAWTNDYNYVPGLHEDDPPDLVLMYFNRPTRWNWHGDPPTIFKNKAWIIIPVNFNRGWNSQLNPGREFGECSERVSLDEFRMRLRRTLDFIRTNERPDWQTVVAEHEKFLASVGH